MKQKTCKICKSKFEPIRQLQPTCTDEVCMRVYAMKTLSRISKPKISKEHRIEKKKFYSRDLTTLNTRAKKIAQKYARLRDIDEPCISCRKPIASQWDGGHYMNQKDYSKIRYSELNIHKQCSHCNDMNSSNGALYRKHLIDKIGLEKVEWLESQRGEKKWTIEELQNTIETYRQKLKEMV